MAITRYYKIISPRSPNVDITDSQNIGGSQGVYGNYTWYSRLVQGSNTRIHRLREYDIMDSDIDIARALNIIADEMTSYNPKTELPLELLITAGVEEQIASNVVVTLQAALKTWCKLQSWDTRLRPVVRNTIKYGDTFFYRSKKKHKKWIPLFTKNVIGAVTALDDVTDVRGWHIKTDVKKVHSSMGGAAGGNNFSQNGNLYDQNVDVFNADEIIWYSLNDDMSEEAPFGISLLRTIYRTFKQKELLEDSIIIYRIVRAPERRVFYIDTGKMPAHKVAQHLEQVKNEFRQKKIPQAQGAGGGNQVDSIYNPQSIQEDIFLSTGSDGRGTKVETLPAGVSNFGSEELQWFYMKMWRGLEIPATYIGNAINDMQPANDGAVGLAYIQEINFAKKCERLQKHIERVMDLEFKKFLYDIKLNVDTTVFKLQLPAPTNWSKSKQNKIDNDLVNVYNAVKDDETISKRYAKKKYLGWTQEEIILNQRQLCEERGLDPEKAEKNLPMLYAREIAEQDGMDYNGSLNGGGGGNPDDGGENLEGEEGAEGGTGEEGGEGETQGGGPESNNTSTPAPKNKGGKG